LVAPIVGGVLAGGAYRVLAGEPPAPPVIGESL
jgi:hypothetical protein